MENISRVETNGELPDYDVDSGTDLRQEVEEIKDVVHGIVDEAGLAERVESLRITVDDIFDEIQSWRNGRNRSYVESVDTLRAQVTGIEEEWESVSSTLKTQRERLETLLESFPGIIETSSFRALSLRTTHLEQLVSQLMEESGAKSTKRISNRQLTVSIAALAVMTSLWTLSMWLTNS